MVNFIARSTLWGTVQIGPGFDRLGFEEQEAVMWHEKGHIANFHAWIRLWWVITGKCFRRQTEFDSLCRAQELEADKHAAIHGHAKGLIRLLSRLPNRYDPAYPMPWERIERLMNYV